MLEQVIEPGRFFHRLTLAGLEVQTSNNGTAATPAINTDPDPAA